jgi:hypothetical protein
VSAEAKRTIGFVCPKCRQSVIVDRSVFSLTAAPTKIACPCGGSQLCLEYQGDRFVVEAPCVICGGRHRATCPSHAFLHQKALGFSCAKTGLGCCYVGEEESVYGAIQHLEQSMDTMDEQKEQPGTFLNDIVMAEMLGELKDIAARKDISCTCGSKEWNLKVHYASLELDCAQCGGILRLPAGTMDDLNNLCCQKSLVIHGAAK